ncbi:MAG: amidohydrolase family protein [Ramlibacter sp.]
MATLIHGGHVLSPDGSTAECADVLIDDGVVAAISSPGTHSKHGPMLIDAYDGLVIPGLANAHTHAHGALARGAVPDRISLEGFLAYAPALIGHRSIEDIRLSATLGAVELARNGCTSCIDMPAQLPLASVEGILAVGQAYADVGLRAVVAPMVSDRTLYQAYPSLAARLPTPYKEQAANWKAPPAATLLQVCRDAQRAWPFDRRQVQLGVGPAIPLHCSDELLAGCADISREFGVPLQTHLLESKLQAAAQGVGMESTVQRLHRLGCLNERTSLAHGVWTDESDMVLIAATGATLVHNPASNMRLGSGVAPLRQWLAAGVRAAIGTDASNTSDGQNMFEAMRLAAYLSRVASPDWESWVDAQEAFALATHGASRALGMDGAVGHMQVGQLADLVIVDLAQPHYVPLRHALRQLVFGESGAGVRSTIVGGKVIFTQGRVTTIDESALRAAAQDAAARLDSDCGPAAAFAKAIHPALAAFCCAGQRVPPGVHRQLFRFGDSAQGQP